jgi:Lrp/AsnC family transcriptional regulator for asnA, asnC and gidA
MQLSCANSSRCVRNEIDNKPTVFKKMKNSQNGLPELDELDLMLVQELEKNARISYLALASKMGTSQPTVRRRFNRLVDQGIIAIAAVPAYAALGYRTILVLAINAPPGTLNTLTRQLASANSIKYFWITAGRYDVMAVGMYRSYEEYIRLFPEELGRIPANVKIETMLSVKVLKRSWAHLTDDVATVDSNSRVILTELDLSVMRGLEKSPRVPVKELAQDIGASLSSVRSSLLKLTSQGIIRAINNPDPAALGYNISGITLIQVHPSSLTTLTDKLKVNPSVHQMALTFGSFNCIVWTAFQNSDQMRHFLVEDLGNMPGVVNYESLVILGTQKTSFSLLSKNRSNVNGPE